MQCIHNRNTHATGWDWRKSLRICLQKNGPNTYPSTVLGCVLAPFFRKHFRKPFLHSHPFLLWIYFGMVLGYGFGPFFWRHFRELFLQSHPVACIFLLWIHCIEDGTIFSVWFLSKCLCNLPLQYCNLNLNCVWSPVLLFWSHGSKFFTLPSFLLNCPFRPLGYSLWQGSGLRLTSILLKFSSHPLGCFLWQGHTY